PYPASYPSFTGAPSRSLAAIQLALGDVAHDSVRHQVPDGVSLGDSRTAVRGGDGEGGHLDEGDPALGEPGVAEVVAGPGDADEVRQGEQFLAVAPGEDLGEGVGAGDEEQVRVRVERAQVAQGVHGVGGAAAVDVDAAHGELRVLDGGDDRHQIAVLRRGDRPVALLPRLSGGHEDHLVEVEARGDLAGRDEVTVVDRVEGAAHDAQTALALSGRAAARAAGSAAERGAPPAVAACRLTGRAVRRAGRHVLLHASRPYRPGPDAPAGPVAATAVDGPQRSRLKRVVIHSSSRSATRAPPPAR